MEWRLEEFEREFCEKQKHRIRNGKLEKVVNLSKEETPFGGWIFTYAGQSSTIIPGTLFDEFREFRDELNQKMCRSSCFLLCSMVMIANTLGSFDKLREHFFVSFSDLKLYLKCVHSQTHQT